MTHGPPAIAWAVWSLVVLVVAGGILAAGYAAYRARRAREEAQLASRAPGPDPTEGLADVNDELADRLAEARARLEGTRDAVRDGVRW